MPIQTQDKRLEEDVEKLAQQLQGSTTGTGMVTPDLADAGVTGLTAIAKSITDGIKLFVDAVVAEPIFYFCIGPVSDQSPGSVVSPTPQFQGTRKGDIMADLTLKDNQDCVIRAATSGKDKKGQTVPVTLSNQDWMVDNSELLSVTPATDGSCSISAIGPVGDAVVSLTATDDAGDQVGGSLNVHIVPSAVTSVDINADTPTDQP
jgi:hypothetical protein